MGGGGTVKQFRGSGRRFKSKHMILFWKSHTPQTRHKTADNNHQTGNSRQQAADKRQEAAHSTQHPSNLPSPREINKILGIF